MLSYSKRESVSASREDESSSRKRSLESDVKESLLPPPKVVKNEEDVDLIGLMEKIPSDMKLTRAQFEQLLRAHKASNARREPSPALSSTSSKDSRSRGRQRSRSPNISVRVKAGM